MKEFHLRVDEKSEINKEFIFIPTLDLDTIAISVRLAIIRFVVRTAREENDWKAPTKSLLKDKHNIFLVTSA